MVERILQSTRLCMGVAGTVIFLIGLLLITRAMRPPKPAETLPAETQDEESTVPDEMGEDVITLPFYPNFDNIHTLTDLDALEKHLYSVDETAYVYESDFDIPAFLEMDFKTNLNGGAAAEPKILIFHTHSQESFIDSRPGEEDDTIVGVGSLLARILAEEYGVSVVHDKGRYDMLDGNEMRDGSYERMEPSVLALLEKYPSVEVTVDLHRDGVPDEVHLLNVIDGKPTARIMFFNGITRLKHKGEPVDVPSLPNPHVKENLGLSLQLQLTANTLYPGFARKIYIRPYRYSLHFKAKSMLVEAGANTNTLAEVQNAMKPLAEILMQVLHAPEDN